MRALALEDGRGLARGGAEGEGYSPPPLTDVKSTHLQGVLQGIITGVLANEK